MVYYSLPSWADNLLDSALGYIWDVVARPFLWTYSRLRYAFLPPPVSWGWTREQYMAVNLVRMRGRFVKYLRLMPADPFEELVAVPTKLFCDRLQCRITNVICPRLDSRVPRLGPLTRARHVVVDKDRAGWFIVPEGPMTYKPKSSISSGEKAHLGSEDVEPAGDHECIFYYINGGGYAGGHPLTLHTPFSLANLSGQRVFAISYRKSLSDQGAFPGSLTDTLVGYQYLVKTLGFRPKNIILSGDSAGGNACLALARYLGELEDQGYTELGQVGGMFINSPWADMTASLPSYRKNAYFDVLSDLSDVMIPSHARHFKGELTNPYFSPALAPSGGFDHLARHGVRICMSVGTAEIFEDEVYALHESLLRDGVNSQCRTVLGGIHSEFVFAGQPVLPGGLGWSWILLAADAAQLWNAVSSVS